MKNLFFIFTIFSFSILFVEKSFALENSFFLHVGDSSGDKEVVSAGVDADIEDSTLGFDFTHYLGSLDAGDAPLGEREFLSHPSNLFLTFDSGSGDLETIDHPSVLATDFEEETEDSLFVLGGTYYFNDTTGFNLALISNTIDIDQFNSGVKVQTIGIDISGITIGIDHYLQDNISIGATITSLSGDVDIKSLTEKIDVTEETFSISARALINNNVSLSAEVTTGSFEWDSPVFEDSDISALDLHVGYYTSSNNEIYFFHETYEEDADEEEVKSGIGDKFYFSEKSFLKAEIYSVEIDIIDDTFWKTESKSGVDLELGFYF